MEKPDAAVRVVQQSIPRNPTLILDQSEPHSLPPVPIQKVLWAI